MAKHSVLAALMLLVLLLWSGAAASAADGDVAMGPPSEPQHAPPQPMQREQSVATPQTGAAPVSSATLEAEINQALKAGRLGNVTARVASDFEVTLRGSVSNAAEKQRAVLIARAFKEVERVKDEVSVVEESLTKEPAPPAPPSVASTIPPRSKPVPKPSVRKAPHQSPATAKAPQQSPSVPSTQQSPPLMLRGSVPYATYAPHSAALGNFADAVNKNSSTPVKLEVLPADAWPTGFFGMRLDPLDALAEGELGYIWVSPGYFYDRHHALALVHSPPFGPSAPRYVQWRRDKAVDATIDVLYRLHLGAKGILCGVVGSYGDLWSQQRIRQPSDLSGIELGALDLRLEIFANAGVSVNPVLFDELVSASDWGINAIHLAEPATGLQMGLQDRMKYLYYPGALTPATGLDVIFDARKWDQFTREVQATIAHACERNVQRMLDQNETQQRTALSALAKAGVQVEPLPAPVVSALRTAWRKVAAGERADPIFGMLLNSLQPYETPTKGKVTPAPPPVDSTIPPSSKPVPKPSVRKAPQQSPTAANAPEQSFPTPNAPQLSASVPSTQQAPPVASAPEAPPATGQREQPAIAPVSNAALEAEINQALREGRVGNVTARIENNSEVTLRGSVSSAAEKQRAFVIARAFREVARVKDQVFVVEE